MPRKADIDRARLRLIWRAMKGRCLSPNNNSYKRYGDRGIKICDRWLNFDNFYNDMIDSYIEHVEIYGKKDTTIDRINVNGNYEPGNCKWATRAEQANNRRNTMSINYYGNIYTLKQLMDAYPFDKKYQTVRDRLATGYSIFEAVAIPSDTHMSASNYLKSNRVITCPIEIGDEKAKLPYCVPIVTTESNT